MAIYEEDNIGTLIEQINELNREKSSIENLIEKDKIEKQIYKLTKECEIAVERKKIDYSNEPLDLYKRIGSLEFLSKIYDVPQHILDEPEKEYGLSSGKIISDITGEEIDISTLPILAKVRLIYEHTGKIVNSDENFFKSTFSVGLEQTQNHIRTFSKEKCEKLEKLYGPGWQSVLMDAYKQGYNETFQNKINETIKEVEPRRQELFNQEFNREVADGVELAGEVAKQRVINEEWERNLQPDNSQVKSYNVNDERLNKIYDVVKDAGDAFRSIPNKYDAYEMIKGTPILLNFEQEDDKSVLNSLVEMDNSFQKLMELEATEERESLKNKCPEAKLMPFSTFPIKVKDSNGVESIFHSPYFLGLEELEEQRKKALAITEKLKPEHRGEAVTSINELTKLYMEDYKKLSMIEKQKVSNQVEPSSQPNNNTDYEESESYKSR